MISLLNLLIAVLVASNLYDAWQRGAQIRMLRTNANVSNILYHAEKYLSLERGVAMSVLYAPSDSFESLIEDLEESRTMADQALSQALTYLENETAYDIPAAIGRVREKRMALEAVRAEFDKKKSSIAEARAPELLNRYFQAVTDLAMETGRLVESYTLITAKVDATALQQIRLKQVIWQITEFAAREYAVTGTMVATSAYPPPEVQADLHVWRGHVELGWKIAHTLAQGSGLLNALQPYMDEAESHYFLIFDQLKDIFYDPDVRSPEAPYPIGIELWLEMATQAVESFRVMQDKVLVESLQYIDRLEKESQRKTLLSVVFFVASLALGFYSGYVVIFRVVRPVNLMVEALYKAIQGKSYDAPVARSYSDEIGKLSRVLEVFRDQARELEERRNYLKTVLSTILDAIITIDKNGKIQMINRAAEHIFGYDEAELIGSNVTMLMPDKYVVPHQHGLERYLETGQAKIIGTLTELEGVRKNGQVFPLEISITEMHQNGERLFVGVIRDITQRKIAEDKIRKSMEELERSNMELDDFAYIASHDLKEPLRGLHNFSGFLLEDYEDKLDEEGKSMLRTIAALTQQMEGLINALLHYSRLGRTELSIQRTDLNTLVKSVLGIFAITIEQKGAEIKIKNLPTIVCDHVRVKEVFQNLIGNALKYTNAKKPVIEIGVTKSHPEMPGQQVFYVKDNGIGIDARNLSSIFKIFRRLHPHNAFGGGTGSGLTIAKKIINQHGGKIWAESEGEGKGAVFYFTIPLQTKKD